MRMKHVSSDQEKVSLLEIDSKNFDAKALKPAAQTLKRGGVIAYPTETVYGLGANIFHQKAVQKIYLVKRRDPHKPISVMIASLEDVDEFCTDIHDYARGLMQKYWPGPLTLILKASENLPRYVTSADRKIGLRFPDHPITKALMVHHCQPITSTSANLTGGIPPVNAQELNINIADKIDLIVDAGPCSVQIPSTVLDCSGDKPKLIREGSITIPEFNKFLRGTVS